MEEIKFKGTEPVPEGAYKPYVPETVKLLSITQGFSLPLLSPEAGGPKSAKYSINDGMLTLFVDIKLSNEDLSSSVTVPLAMCPYVKPEGDSIYNAEICREATFTNITRETHNTFLVKILNAVMQANDLGTSAGKVTCPDPPADANKLRLQAIKELTSDKLGTAKKAIKYLAQYEIYCGRDYEFDESFDKANDVCFKETCKKRASANGGKKIRVQLEGCPPSWWDGISEKDSAGHYVAWSKGNGHTFLTPCVNIVRIPDPTPVVAMLEGPMDTKKVALLEAAAKPSSFDDLILKPASATPLSLPAPPKKE